MISALIYIVIVVADFLFWVIVIDVVLSLLINFNVINPYNQFVRTVHTFTHRVSEPLLAPVRRVLPDLGGIDISPMVVIALIVAARIMIVNVLSTGTLFS